MNKIFKTALALYAIVFVQMNCASLPGGVSLETYINSSPGEGTLDNPKQVTLKCPASELASGSDPLGALFDAFAGNYVAVDLSGVTGLALPDMTYTAVYYRSNKDKLVSLVLPSGLISIGDMAFWNCRELASVTIPRGVTSIGDGAFYWCSALSSVTIPSSVTSIGEMAFAGCGRMISITVDPDNANYSSEDGVLFDKAKAALVHYPGGKTGPYAIPSSVVSIGNAAFSWCSGLSSVTIPASVTSIGGWAFSWCSGLSSVAIPASVTSIGGWAFYECDRVISITVDPDNANYSSEDGVLFDKAKSALIQCPNGKTGHYAIPSGVTSIGEGAFYMCIGLSSVTIPQGVASIGEMAFSGCEGLSSVTIPQGVASIGKMMFSWCSGLSSVTIPASVTSIGDRAFESCDALAVVTMERYESGDADPVTALSGRDVFLTFPERTGDNALKIYVPAAGVEAYKTAANWSALADRIFAKP